MLEKYTSEQFWKLYNKLPQELKGALFAEEMGNDIYEICERNDVLDQHKQILALVSRVLLGTLPPKEFEEMLKKELKLTKETIKKVVQEINRFIFYPVRPSLEELYRIEILPSSPKESITGTEEPVSQSEKEESASPRKDTYRETLE